MLFERDDYGVTCRFEGVTQLTVFDIMQEFAHIKDILLHDYNKEVHFELDTSSPQLKEQLSSQLERNHAYCTYAHIRTLDVVLVFEDCKVPTLTMTDFSFMISRLTGAETVRITYIFTRCDVGELHVDISSRILLNDTFVEQIIQGDAYIDLRANRSKFTLNSLHTYYNTEQNDLDDIYIILIDWEVYLDDSEIEELSLEISKKKAVGLYALECMDFYMPSVPSNIQIANSSAYFYHRPTAKYRCINGTYRFKENFITTGDFTVTQLPKGMKYLGEDVFECKHDYILMDLCENSKLTYLAAKNRGSEQSSPVYSFD